MTSMKKGTKRSEVMKSNRKCNLVSMTIVVVILVTGCAQQGENTDTNVKERIGDLPETADILFVSNRDTNSRRAEIYATDIDTGDVTRLTFTEEHHFILGIDRSRRYIVASRAEKDTDPPSGLGNEDRRALWVIDLETKEEVRLTDPRHHAEGDSFSPDGEWIVFLMRLSGEDQSDIYKVRRDGSELTRLTHTLNAVEGDPAWSHNGKEIAFVYLDAQTQRFVLKTMDTNGGTIQTVYDGEGVSTPAFPPGCYDPSWSPDDQWLVFEKAVSSAGENWGGGIWHIFRVKRDGTGLTDLSLAGGHTDRAEYLPSYSPDGQSIVFGSLYQAETPEQSHNDIFVMDINGIARRLTHNPASDMYPVWMPHPSSHRSFHSFPLS